MRRFTFLSVAILLGTTGCFTSWALTQGTGSQRVWDENVREETVPLPGVEERLVVTLPLALEIVDTSGIRTSKPFALECKAEQQARDAVYHSAYRYGSRWKKGTALMFVLEGALATTFLALGKREDPREVLAGGFLALDALGTAAVFFAPRKEIYRRDEKPITTALRTDCPDGLVLEIAGDSFPVNAAGRLGELGDVALDAWMESLTGSIAMTYEGRSFPLTIGVNEQCAWNRAHHPETTRACPAYGGFPTTVSTWISVPAGTLTTVASE